MRVPVPGFRFTGWLLRYVRLVGQPTHVEKSTLRPFDPRSRGSTKRSWFLPQGLRVRMSAIAFFARKFVQPAGNRRLPSTRASNRLCRRVCYLPPACTHVPRGLLLHDTYSPLLICLKPASFRLTYAIQKGLFFVLENPTGTLLWRYWPLRATWLPAYISKYMYVYQRWYTPFPEKSVHLRHY